MGVRALALGWVFSLLFLLPARAQKVDPAVEAAGNSVVPALKKAVAKWLPKGAEITVWPGDGRVYAWRVDLSKQVDFPAMGKEAGLGSTDVPKCIDAWSARLAGKLADLTKKEVARARTDPDFNPDLDVTLNVSGHVLPADTNGTWGDFYSVSFTGTRRNRQTDTVGHVTRPAEGNPPGGEIAVTIKPEHPTWGLRQTLAGQVTITNTGKRRVHVESRWSDWFEVTDPKGKAAPFFPLLGNVDPAPGWARYLFLKPGESRSESFSLCTDRAYTMRNGYYLAEGDWLLRFPPYLADNLTIDADPARVTVRAKPGESPAPRIADVRGAGPHLVLTREDGRVEVVHATTGKCLGTTSFDEPKSRTMWWEPDRVFSSDARLLACSSDRDGPIHLRALFGDPPTHPEIAAPPGLKLGMGGFSAQRFTPDGKHLVGQTNDTLVLIDLASGGAARTIPLPEMWVQASPAASAAVQLIGSQVRIVDYRGKDAATLAIIDLAGDAKPRHLTLKGHGEHPDLTPGLTGVYLCDEFASGAAFVSYAKADPREFKTDAPCDVVGESADGKLVALSWPRSERGDKPGPTTVAVYRVSDGARLARVSAPAPQAMALLESPLRIALIPRTNPGDPDGNSGLRPRFANAASLFDALTGKPAGTLNLTPP